MKKTRIRRNILRFKGFSLVELVIAIAVIGIMSATAVPFIKGYLDRGKRTKTQVEMDELGNAIHTFVMDTRKFPLAPNNTVCGQGPSSAGTSSVDPAWEQLFFSCSSTQDGWNGPYTKNPSVVDGWNDAYQLFPGEYRHSKPGLLVSSKGRGHASITTVATDIEISPDDLGIKLIFR
ncbi:type II secretion system protein [Deltaproteobacteria bacterium TL4]